MDWGIEHTNLNGIPQPILRLVDGRRLDKNCDTSVVLGGCQQALYEDLVTINRFDEYGCVGYFGRPNDGWTRGNLKGC